MSKEQYIEFPEEYTRRELNARYREIPLKDTTSRLLRKYFNAMANLYGIIPLHKAKEIIFTLSPKLVTEDEFLAFAEIARHECEDYLSLIHISSDLAKLAASEPGFTANNTLATIEHGELTVLARSYTP